MRDDWDFEKGEQLITVTMPERLWAHVANAFGAPLGAPHLDVDPMSTAECFEICNTIGHSVVAAIPKE